MPFTKERVYDPEIAQAHTTTSSDQDLPLNSKETAIHSSSLQEGSTWYAKAHHYASRFGVESRGIERVPSDERSTAGMSQIGTLWLSANLVVSSFAIGALSYPVFHLGFVDTVLIILFVNLLGVIPAAFFSMFGPRFGLRQMVLSRFYFGWYGVKISELSPLSLNASYCEFRSLDHTNISSCNLQLSCMYWLVCRERHSRRATLQRG